MKKLSVAFLLCACGSSQPAPATTATAASAPPPPPQSLADAVRLVCDATTRAENDPAFQRATDAKASILGGHIKEGVTNARVLAAIDGWSSETSEARLSTLDALTKEAGIATCPLRQIWVTADDPCTQAIDHQLSIITAAASHLDADKRQLQDRINAKLRPLLARACVDDNWSAAAIHCVSTVQANDPEMGKKCDPLFTERQRKSIEVITSSVARDVKSRGGPGASK